MTADEPGAIIDPAHTAHLADDLHAVVAITPTGQTALWLIVGDIGNDEPAGCACPDHAPHEQLGPLPLWACERLAGVDVPRCGAPTRTTGRPCLALVEYAGLRCRWHREAIA